MGKPCNSTPYHSSRPSDGLVRFPPHHGIHNAFDSPDSYAVAWIAALSIERAAAEAMLDEEHAAPIGFAGYQTDANVYTWGRVGEHNTAIASLAAGVYGTTSAATTASHLLASLPSIRVVLLVGIGGSIAQPDEGHDIRLGDIAVSEPDGTTGGVCQYDLVKAKSGDKRERKGFLGRLPTVPLNALASIQADHERNDPKIPCSLQEMLEKNSKMGKRSKQNPLNWPFSAQTKWTGMSSKEERKKSLLRNDDKQI